MKKTLVLRLSGPLQSWGSTEGFRVRGTDPEPTKSGVVGLLGAALGRERGSDVSDLTAMRMVVRTDRPGQVVKDFHTTEHKPGVKQLTDRLYIADAQFTVALEGESALVDSLAEALKRPKWALSLGRRACVPSAPVLRLVTDETAYEVLSRLDLDQVDDLESGMKVTADAPTGSRGSIMHDVPLNTISSKRTFGHRLIVEDVLLSHSEAESVEEHDPFSIV